jgi:hypothetical protein
VLSVTRYFLGIAGLLASASTADQGTLRPSLQP